MGRMKTQSSLVTDLKRLCMIKPYTARIWLNKLGYQYTDIKKGVFLDGPKRPDMIEY